jgi:hypothetical protein
MKFNSTISTSREQSERLIALGLKTETADMYYFWMGGNEYILKIDVDNNPLKYNMDKTYIPAWSLDRLIDMLNNSDTHEDYKVDFYVGLNRYDEIIALIQSLIHIGGFNKEYING